MFLRTRDLDPLRTVARIDVRDRHIIARNIEACEAERDCGIGPGFGGGDNTGGDDNSGGDNTGGETTDGGNTSDGGSEQQSSRQRSSRPSGQTGRRSSQPETGIMFETLDLGGAGGAAAVRASMDQVDEGSLLSNVQLPNRMRVRLVSKREVDPSNPGEYQIRLEVSPRGRRRATPVLLQSIDGHLYARIPGPNQRRVRGRRR